jgi:hypothetical protein
MFQPGCRENIFRVPQKYLKYIFIFKHLHEKYRTVSNKTDLLYVYSIKPIVYN